MPAAGQGRRRALGAATSVGLSTLLGGLGSAPLMGLLGPRLAVSAGVMIYVAASDLVPEVNRERGLRMTLLVFPGVALLIGTDRLLPTPSAFELQSLAEGIAPPVDFWHKEPSCRRGPPP